ncbi:MAG: hypothetical protein ACKO3V_06860 [Pirellula sp.]
MRLESTAHFWLFGGRLVIESKESKRFAVSIRVPSWVDEGASLKVNGKLIAGQGVESKLVPGEFYSIDRQWQDQDRIEYEYPYDHSIRVRRARYIRLTTLPNPELKDHQARPKIAEIMVFGEE